MTEHLVQKYFGVHSADAERIELSFSKGDLLLRYIDWRDARQEKVFSDSLAFRWQEFSDEAPRDDMTYEVCDSRWLASQAALQGVDPESYSHYRLCFNACGVLDVICKRLQEDVQHTFGH